MGTLVTFPANGHTTGGYLALPASKRGPGVLVIQEWWGLVDHIKELCDRFAAEGFVALAPDLYHGETTKSPDDAGKLFMALNIDRAGVDLRGAAEHLLSLEECISSRAGVVGFCMGGQLALYAGMKHPDRIAAVVDFYGIHPKVEIDPAQVTVPVIGHFGKEDASVPLDGVHALARAIREAGGSMEVHEYDAGHAFFNDTRPVYNAKEAELAWSRTLAFLGWAMNNEQ